MWNVVVGSVMAAICGALAGRWFSIPAGMRRLARLQAEVAVHQGMPEGAARSDLGHKIEVDVLTFLDLERNRAFGRWLFAGRATVVVTALGAGITTAMLVIVAVKPDTGLWAEVTVATTTVVVIAAGSASLYIREKLNEIERASVEQAESATDRED